MINENFDIGLDMAVLSNEPNKQTAGSKDELADEEEEDEETEGDDSDQLEDLHGGGFSALFTLEEVGEGPGGQCEPCDAEEDAIESAKFKPAVHSAAKRNLDLTANKAIDRKPSKHDRNDDAIHPCVPLAI